MRNAIAITWNRESTIASTQLVSLLGVAVIAPMFAHQLITGSLVNATLFIATGLLGVRAGVLVGMFPSIVALSLGTLPAPLAPMLPFIVLSNALLVSVFALFSKRYWRAMVLASGVKYAFLFLASSVIVGLLPQQEWMRLVAVMMSWPQLVTALVGGCLAFVVLKTLRKV
jgi:hypothetical protein